MSIMNANIRPGFIWQHGDWKSKGSWYQGPGLYKLTNTRINCSDLLTKNNHSRCLLAPVSLFDYVDVFHSSLYTISLSFPLFPKTMTFYVFLEKNVHFNKNANFIGIFAVL